MKTILNKTVSLLSVVLPFLKRSRPEELKAFTTLITDQYEFLIGQLNNALKEYFLLSEKIRDMHEEIRELNDKLNQALKLQCKVDNCKTRET